MGRNIRMRVPIYKTDREKQMMNNRERRKTLLEKAKKTKPKANPTVKTEKEVPTTPQFENLKSQIKQLKQQLASEKAQHQRSERKSQQQIRDLKIANRKLRQEKQVALAEADAKLKENLEKIKLKKTKLYQAKIHLEREQAFLDSVGWNQSDELSTLLAKQSKLAAWWAVNYLKSAEIFTHQRQTCASLKNKDRQLQKENQRLKEELKKEKQKNDRLRHQLHELNASIHATNEELRSRRAEIWLEHLIDYLTPTTLSQYDQLETLNRKLLQTFKVASKQSFSSNLNQQLRFVYGYLQVDDGQFFIYDVNHETKHPLIISEHQQALMNLEDGIAIKAQRNVMTDQYTLVRIYPVINHVRLHEAKLKTPKKVKSQTQTTIADERLSIVDQAKLNWLAAQRILVVGNKRAQAFVDTLKPYVEVKLMDGYEDHPRQIFIAMKAADYVFILIDSVPHAITDYTKTQSDLAPGGRKVQIFRNPQPDAGLARLNYLYATK